MEIVKQIIKENEMKKYMTTKECRAEKKVLEYQNKKKFDLTMNNYFKRYNEMKKIYNLDGNPNKYGIIMYIFYFKLRL